MEEIIKQIADRLEALGTEIRAAEIEKLDRYRSYNIAQAHYDELKKEQRVLDKTLKELRGE